MFLGIKKVKKDVLVEIELDVRIGMRKICNFFGIMKLGKGKKDDKVVFVVGVIGKVGLCVVR